jgi:mRNA-degrading endonuclease toxin of MazEF toxin-antitoxin module
MSLASIEQKPGGVWIVDFGSVAKHRPVVVLAFPQPEDACALVIVAPLTSRIHGHRGEVDIGKPKWLSKNSAVNVQGLASIDQNSLARRLGRLPVSQFNSVKEALRDLLNL